MTRTREMDGEVVERARREVGADYFEIFPSDVATVEVFRRKHWWSLRRSWVTIGSFDAYAVRTDSGAS